MQKKLNLACCDDPEKITNVASQLSGIAGDWWDAYIYAHEDADNITWQEFKTAFRTHHIPTSTMKLKKKEFLILT